MPLVLRSVKGSALSIAEFDGNLTFLGDRITVLEESPPEAVSIDSFEVEGAQMTIVMTDATTHGPFTLPVAQWRFTGAWGTGITYFVGDLFTNEGSLYYVRVQHVSDLVEFDPATFTVDGFVYQLLLPRVEFALTVDFFYAPLIDEGETIIFQYVCDRDFTVSANFEDAKAYLRVATASVIINLPIYLNAAQVGDIRFTPGETVDGQGGQYGVFIATTPDTDIALVAGDILAVGLPYSGDDVAAGLSVNIPAVVLGI